jgi:hypothetical protein
MAKDGMTAKERNRLMNKLHRLAYELEHDAARLRASCPAYAADGDALKAIASSLGSLVRRGD